MGVRRFSGLGLGLGSDSGSGSGSEEAEDEDESSEYNGSGDLRTGRFFSDRIALDSAGSALCLRMTWSGRGRTVFAFNAVGEMGVMPNNSAMLVTVAPFPRFQ